MHPAHQGFHNSLWNNAKFKTLFSPSVSKPVVTAPAVMPMADDAAIAAAKKKKQASMMSGSGRQSTILTDYGNADKLG